MTKQSVLLLSVSLMLIAALSNIGIAATCDSLDKNFQNPPDSSKPWTYWWWLNGYVTKQGVTKDLEEMKRQGISGVLIFNAGGPAGPMPSGSRFLSPVWREMFEYAIREAARLGIEVSINLCDGWDCGGPWITPEFANKKLVYSEAQADGQTDFDNVLPMPPVMGNYYRDVAVVAFREKDDRPVTPAIISASRSMEGYCREMNWPVENIIDCDPQTYWRVHPKLRPSERPIQVQFQFPEPISVSGVYLLPLETGGPRECEVQSSEDGDNFKTVVAFEMLKGKSKTVNFPEVRSKHFRVVIKSAHLLEVQLAELWLLRKTDKLYMRNGIKWWMFKSGNRSFWDWPKEGPIVMQQEYPEQNNIYDCRKNEVLDLTRYMDTQGRLKWNVPAGRWTILRFGYTLEGQKTRCYTSVQGYEADMLSKKSIERHFEFTTKLLLNEVPDAVGKTLKYLHIDSYELGADVQGQQPTWSEEFRREFKTRRGYDLLPYLPTLARRIVDSRQITNRFLWDIRRTIADLMAENFFGRYAELAHERGVGVHSETGYGTYPHPHIDGLQCAGQNDITMSEFWYGTDIAKQFNHFCNFIRSVASAGHIYGRRIIQAEAFTTWLHFTEYPYAMKVLGDEVFCDGLNRMVFHQYTHQPQMDIKPGWQYFAGTHIDRNITWWELGRAWFEYLARCQYLLQEGVFHADACYFYGEGATKFVPSKEYLQPALPAGYDFDCINADILLNRLTVEAGRLVLPSGTSYRLLVLPQEQTMSPPVLEKIKALIESGATVLGSKPLWAPGLTDYPDCDRKLRKLTNQMWGPDTPAKGQKTLGQGLLFWGEPVGEVLRTIGVLPDVEFRDAADGSPFKWIHRLIGQTELYFLSNQSDGFVETKTLFNISDKQPELWDPVEGRIRDLPEFSSTEDGRTLVPMTFDARQSWFVVFRNPAQKTAKAQKNFPSIKTLTELQGPWNVSFDPDWGGPESTVFDELVDWTKHAEDGIRYYSGTAMYSKTFDMPGSAAERGRRLFLDLGTVSNIAQVRLNGRSLGIVWTAPWRVDITDVVKQADNKLEIDIVNLWINRMVGDTKLPPKDRFTQTNVKVKPGQPLLPSGLLGPVSVKVAQ